MSIDNKKIYFCLFECLRFALSFFFLLISLTGCILNYNVPLHMKACQNDIGDWGSFGRASFSSSSSAHCNQNSSSILVLELGDFDDG